MKPTLVRELLTDLLAAAVDVVDNEPDRQIVAQGDFAHDCEQIGVRCVDITLEGDDLGAGSPGCAVIPIITLQLVLLRCWPTVTGDGTPPAADITAAALVLADDAVALTGDLLDRWRAGTLFPTANVHCSRVEVGPLVPVSPAGGLAGWTLSMTVRA